MANWYGRQAVAEELLKEFGRRLRQARAQAGISQMRLEELSGVDQTMISRLELGKGAHVSLERIVLLGEVLGSNFPLGTCPHQHACSLRPAWIGRPD